MSDTATIVRAVMAGTVVTVVLPPEDAEHDHAGGGGDAFAASLKVVPATLVGQVAQGWTCTPDAQGNDVWAPATLSAAELRVRKDGLKALLDGEAERLRLTYVTPGAGQAAEYAEVQAQAFTALAADAAGKPVVDADYQMLAASIGIDKDPKTGQPAIDVLGVARSVQAAYDAWIAIGSAIRSARLKGKAAIEAAASLDAALAAFAAAAWPPEGT